MACCVLYKQMKQCLSVLPLGYFTGFTFKKSTVIFRFN